MASSASARVGSRYLRVTPASFGNLFYNGLARVPLQISVARRIRSAVRTVFSSNYSRPSSAARARRNAGALSVPIYERGTKKEMLPVAGKAVGRATCPDQAGQKDPPHLW